MNRLFRLFLLMFTLSFLVTVFAQETDQEDEDSATLQYIGVAGCKKCHRTTKQGKQFDVWAASAHAKAFETLKSEAAVKIGKEKKLAKAPHESPECLQCHVSGYDAPAEMKAAAFSMEEGVQCETCHGPGSMYKKRSVMKDRAKSIAAGMKDIAVKGGSAEKMCLECHNEKSPTFKPFNFEKRWKEIAHPVPAE